jgi:hypothetical protein
MIEVTNNIYFEGELSETEIVVLLNKLDSWPEGLFKNKAAIKFAIIELCSNVISHHSGTEYSWVSIVPEEGQCLVEVKSYASINDLEILNTILNEIRTSPDLKALYFNKLEQVGNKSANLGILRVFRICDGNLILESEIVASKILLTFKLKINDNN